jgi:hypothetical protein
VHHAMWSRSTESGLTSPGAPRRGKKSRHAQHAKKNFAPRRKGKGIAVSVASDRDASTVRQGAGGESLPPFFVGTPGNHAGEAALWYGHCLAAAAVPAALGRSVLWE